MLLSLPRALSMPIRQHALSRGSDGGRKSDLISWERAKKFYRLQRERGTKGPAHLSFDAEVEEALHSIGIDNVVWCSDGDKGKALAVSTIDSAIESTGCVSKLHRARE